MIGYILGLGDRNLNNILMNNKTCKIIHKNFDTCFEITNKRNQFPEKVPFRLTRTLIKALDITGVDGIFRVTSEKIMEISRNNKYQISTIINSNVFEPCIFFQFMAQKIYTNKPKENSNKNNVYNISCKNPTLKKTRLVTNTIETENEIISNSKILNMEYKQIINFNLYEYAFDSNVLNKIKQKIIMRINDKLTGTDFGNDVLDVDDQVSKLINQATSDENIIQSYIDSSLFW